MKRKIAVLLAAVILAFNSVSVFAEENLSEDVKNAIISAKSKITVEEEYSDFHYETSEEYGQKIYNLVWRNEDYDEYVVGVDLNGNVVYYQSPDAYNYDDHLLVNVRQDEAKRNAESFIKKVIPDRANDLEIVDVSSSRASFTFRFAQKVNDIFVMCYDTDVSVSKQDGKILTFSSYGRYFQDKINKKSDDLIDKEKAKESFFNNDAIKLIYYSDFDYKTKKADIYPVYDISSLSINAHNANVINSSFYSREYSGASASSANGKFMEDTAADAGEADFEFSKAELEEIEKTSGFISSAKAKNALKKYNLIKDNVTVSDGDINISPYNKDEYWWNFSAVDDNNSDNRYSFTVDANSGKINSFRKNNKYNNDAEKVLSEDAAKDKANGYLKLLCPELLNSLNHNDDIRYDKYSNVYTLSFYRKIDNIELNANHVIIQVDAETGELIWFSKVWYNDINIINKQIKLTPEDAFEIYDKYADFNLCYAYVSNEDNGEYNKIDAVYKAVKDSDFKYYIDAENGKRITYWGSEPDNKEFENGYSDISDSKYEEEINILYESGFSLNRNEFNPDSDMTKSDFIELLYSGLENKHYVAKNGDGSKEDILSKINSLDNAMTKNDCAKILIYVIGYGELLDKDEMFEDFYSDVDLKNRAEANITTSLSILEAEEDKFKGDEIISNEEGAHIIYNLISGYWKNKLKF